MMDLYRELFHIALELYGNLQKMHGLSGGMVLNEDYREMLQAFIEEKVEFMVVGAYAVGVHGIPRATGDIDLFVKADKNNSEKVFSALVRFGASVDGISPDDFEKDGIIFQIGVVPRRIDVITSIDGVGFDEAYSEVVFADIDGLNIPVISAEKLIKNKEASARDKDLLDIKILKKHLKLK